MSSRGVGAELIPVQCKNSCSATTLNFPHWKAALNMEVYLITAHCFGMHVKEIVEVFRAMKLHCISTGIHELHVGSTGVVALQVMSPIVTMETKYCSCSVAD